MDVHGDVIRVVGYCFFWGGHVTTDGEVSPLDPDGAPRGELRTSGKKQSKYQFLR